MCWAGMSFNGTTEIALFDCSVNLGYYQSIMQDYLLPDAERLCGPNWQYYLDSASCHTSKDTKKWFQKWNVRVIKTPSNSPDINPIENLWSILAHKAYQN